MLDVFDAARDVFILHSVRPGRNRRRPDHHRLVGDRFRDIEILRHQGWIEKECFAQLVESIKLTVRWQQVGGTFSR